jgi:hypothetical protein
MLPAVVRCLVRSAAFAEARYASRRDVRFAHSSRVNIRAELMIAAPGVFGPWVNAAEPHGISVWSRPILTVG